MELFIFARFQARPGNADAVAAALLEVLPPTREEPGCLGTHAFHSIHDPHLFYIHSRWETKRRLIVTSSWRIRCVSWNASSRCSSTRSTPLVPCASVRWR